MKPYLDLNSQQNK
ncbi:hypothetical protein LINGRAHAP2_LOCUS3366 [Linum grandiflorum]